MADGTRMRDSDGRAELSRRRILRVATQLFAEKGYHATSMVDLQKAAGFQRGGLYHHIGNKEAILYEICRSRLDATVDAAHRVVGAERDPGKRLRQLARERLREIADHRQAWVVIQRDSGSLSPERRAELRAKRNEMTRVWVEVLEAGVGEQASKRVDSVVLMGILGMFEYAALWIHPEGPQTPEQIADTFVALLLVGVEGVAPTP